MKKTLKLLLAVFMCAVVMAGCQGSGNSWVYSKDGDEMSAGLYTFYQMSALQDAQQEYYMDNMQNENFTMPSSLKDMLKVQIDGKSAEQWINDKTQQYVKMHYFANSKFAELGLQENESSIMIAQYTTESIWAQGSAVFEQNNIPKDSILERCKNDIKLQLVFESIYGKDGTNPVSEDEIKSILQNDYLSANIIMPSKPQAVPAGYTKTLEDYTAEVKAIVDNGKAILDSGATFLDVANQINKNLAKASGDDISAEPDIALTDIQIMFAAGDIEGYRLSFPALINAIEAAPFNKAQIIEDAEMFILFERLNPLDVENSMERYGEIIVFDLKYPEFEEQAITEAASIEITANNSAVNRYKVKNLVV